MPRLAWASTANGVEEPCRDCFLGGGEDPIGAAAAGLYHAAMNLLLVTIVGLLFFVGGVYYFGGLVVGGGAIALTLFTCVIVYLMAGFRAKT